MQKVTIGAIAILNKAHANNTGQPYWFEPKLMRFFKTKIESTGLYNKEYFISSDYWASCAYNGESRRYTVQRVNPLDFSIKTLFPIQGFKTLEIAQLFMRQYAKAGTDKQARRFISALPKEVRLSTPTIPDLHKAAGVIVSESDLYRHLIRPVDIALAYFILKLDPLSLYNRDNDY